MLLFLSSLPYPIVLVLPPTKQLYQKRPSSPGVNFINMSAPLLLLFCSVERHPYTGWFFFPPSCLTWFLAHLCSLDRLLFPIVLDTALFIDLLLCYWVSDGSVGKVRPPHHGVICQDFVEFCPRRIKWVTDEAISPESWMQLSGRSVAIE